MYIDYKLYLNNTKKDELQHKADHTTSCKQTTDNNNQDYVIFKVQLQCAIVALMTQSIENNAKIGPTSAESML